MLILIRNSAAFVVAALLVGLVSGVRAAADVGRHADDRPTVDLRLRSPAAGAPAYTLDDIGAPPANTYPSSSPVGFNNTGQIFGTALVASKSDRFSYSSDTDCLVWTGKRFVDLSPSPSIASCTPYAMNAANPESGSVTVVGSFVDIFHPPPRNRQSIDPSAVAFSAAVSVGAGTAAFVPYFDHDPSALYGINSAGATVGYSYVAPYLEPMFVGAPPRELRFLQPACVNAKVKGCLYPIQSLRLPSTAEPPLYCAFGGCTIDDAGEVLGYDDSGYAISTTGAAPSPVGLPLLPGFAVAMNNEGLILTVEIVSGPRSTVTAVYDRASGVATVLPPAAGTNCVHYYPLSINNSGEVLGFTSFCSSRDFYWTWDAKHGTRQVTAAMPAGASKLAAYGVNDEAQILVSFLSATGGTVHWGILKPATASVPKSGASVKAGRDAR